MGSHRCPIWGPYLGSHWGPYLGSHWGPICALFGVPYVPYLGSHWGPIDALFGVPLGSHWGPIGALCGVPSVPYLGSLFRVPLVLYLRSHWGPIGVPPSAFISGLLPRCLWGFLGSLWDPDSRLHTAALPPSTGIIPPSATSTPRGRISACASAMGCGTGT